VTADPQEITRLLQAVSSGDPSAVETLMPLVYDDLRAIAVERRRRWSGDETLGPTALVHEAYLRLIERTGAHWYDRKHFFAVASKAMRQLLLNYAERKRAAKRGGDAHVDHEAEAADTMTSDRADTIVAVDQLLDKLHALDPQKADIVEARFFGGLENEEIAESLGISARTVQRQWQRARAWMHAAMDGLEFA
jgi:RNA polymerase sigma factor (TIGR02999 family)